MAHRTVGNLVARSLVLCVGLALAPIGARAQGDAKPGDRLRSMRAIAETMVVKTNGPSPSVELKRQADPIYRFNDPARQFSDGTVWSWNKGGRPLALLTIAPHRGANESYYWLCEVTSLSETPLQATIPGSILWAPMSSGIAPREFPKAQAPAADESRRMRQMKELARGLKAYEHYRPAGQTSIERYELRLLPQPIARYSDPAAGIVDGGMFIIAYGTNPEIVVLIEARRTDSAAPVWTYGFARIASAELHVELGGRDVWTGPKLNNQAPRDAYWTFVRPWTGNGP